LVTTPAPHWIVANVAIQPRQPQQFNRAKHFQFFGIDYRCVRSQRDRAAGVTGAAATWDDRQPEFHQPGDERSHFGFGVGGQHHKRIFDAPVGRVGDMRHARESVKPDVVAMRDMDQPAHDRFAFFSGNGKPAFEFIYRRGGCTQ